MALNGVEMALKWRRNVVKVARKRRQSGVEWHLNGVKWPHIHFLTEAKVCSIEVRGVLTVPSGDREGERRVNRYCAVGVGVNSALQCGWGWG